MSTPTTGSGIGANAPPPPARRVRRVSRARRSARGRRGALAVAAVVVALVVALPILAGVVAQPVRSVRISGEFAQVSKTDFERTVEPLLAPGLLEVASNPGSPFWILSRNFFSKAVGQNPEQRARIRG